MSALLTVFIPHEDRPDHVTPTTGHKTWWILASCNPGETPAIEVGIIYDYAGGVLSEESGARFGAEFNTEYPLPRGMRCEILTSRATWQEIVDAVVARFHEVDDRIQCVLRGSNDPLPHVAVTI